MPLQLEDFDNPAVMQRVISRPWEYAHHVSRPVLGDGSLGVAAWTPQTVHKLILRTALNTLFEQIDTPVVIVTAPPQIGKSLSVSWALPLWYLSMWPTKRVLLTSYSMDVAKRFGGMVRDTAESGHPLIPIRVRSDQRAESDWNTLQGGGMMCRGVGGSITSFSGDLIIIDDPVSGWEDANSPAEREKAWNWYVSVLRTRRQPKTKTFLTLTRWHHDDLAGRLIEQAKKGGDGVTVVRIPALALDDDPLGREPGEAIWPERFDVDYYEQTRAVDPMIFEALYQGNPGLPGGEFFREENFNRFETTPDGWILHRPSGVMETIERARCRIVQTVDVAGSEKSKADYTVITTFAVTATEDVLVLGVRRERRSTTDHVPMVVESWEAWGRPQMWIESLGIGLALVQGLKKERIPFDEMKYPRTSSGAIINKEARATYAQRQFIAGRWFFPVFAPWLAEFELEMKQFPKAAHDDQADTVSMLGILVARGQIAVGQSRIIAPTVSGGSGLASAAEAARGRNLGGAGKGSGGKYGQLKPRSAAGGGRAGKNGATR